MVESVSGPFLWTPSLVALWRRIDAHPFDPGNPLGFTRRLARDHDWPLPFARDAVREYGRFCFLAVASPTPVTPSEEVDEVWHLHLTYSRDYWEVWCGAVLQAPLHHDPTPGGKAAQACFRAQYAETLALYESCFGPPPEVFWPATYRRFGARPRFRVVDNSAVLTLPRARTLLQRLGIGRLRWN